MKHISLETNAGPTVKPLKLGLAAFLFGCCGVVLGFVIDYGPDNTLSFVALGMVSLSVATGYLAIVWAWVGTARKSKKVVLDDCFLETAMAVLGRQESPTQVDAERQQTEDTGR